MARILAQFGIPQIFERGAAIFGECPEFSGDPGFAQLFGQIGT